MAITEERGASEESRRILRMVAEGKITVEEAEELLDAVSDPSRPVVEEEQVTTEGKQEEKEQAGEEQPSPNGGASACKGPFDALNNLGALLGARIGGAFGKAFPGGLFGRGRFFEFNQECKSVEEDFVFPSEGISGLRCESHNGEFIVKGSDKAQDIKAHVVKTLSGPASDCAADLERFRVASRVEDGCLMLYPEWVGGKPLDRQGKLRFEIELPAGLSMAAMGHNGTVEISGVRSGISIDLHNGTVDVADCGGTIDATTHNTNISIKNHGLGNADGDASASAIRIAAHNGRFMLANCRGDLGIQAHNCSATITSQKANAIRLHTKNGALSLADCRGSLEAEAHNGRIDVARHEGDLNIQTKNGKVDAESIAARVDISATNGKIDAKMSGEGRLDGKIGCSLGHVNVRLDERLSTILSCVVSGSGRVNGKPGMSASIQEPKRFEAKIGGGEGSLQVEVGRGSIGVV